MRMITITVLIWLAAGIGAAFGQAETLSNADPCLLEGAWRVAPASVLADCDRAMKKPEALSVEQRVAVWVSRGRAHITLKEYNVAQADFDQAISANKAAPGGYIGRAELLIAQGKLDEAEQSINQTVSTFSSSIDALYARAELRFMRKRFDEAIADLTTAIKINPRFMKGYELRGRLHLLKREIKEARADQEMFMKLLEED